MTDFLEMGAAFIAVLTLMAVGMLAAVAAAGGVVWLLRQFG